MDDVQSMVHYFATLISNAYAGLLPFSAYLAVQVAADELALQAKPHFFSMVPQQVWMYGIRLAARLIFYPLNTISANLQTGKYDNLLQCVRAIYRERGARGFWDGWATELATFPCEVLRMYLHRRLLLLR